MSSQRQRWPGVSWPAAECGRVLVDDVVAGQADDDPVDHGQAPREEAAFPGGRCLSGLARHEPLVQLADDLARQDDGVLDLHVEPYHQVGAGEPVLERVHQPRDDLAVARPAVGDELRVGPVLDPAHAVGALHHGWGQAEVEEDGDVVLGEPDVDLEVVAAELLREDEGLAGVLGDAAVVDGLASAVMHADQE